ncbi:hypothetical protein OESDEN_17380 [Oesophagostomum dentatum]|uniref:Uncharacterized protein n=1 Tax=Oesophagostomum dentatum TaxID=61180 RepID=A0A0B1SI78_OESDE|nr:hypothetical protein OESDEN_17380 [Oesophagostomum dentatum]
MQLVKLGKISLTILGPSTVAPSNPFDQKSTKPWWQQSFDPSTKDAFIAQSMPTTQKVLPVIRAENPGRVLQHCHA